MNKSCAGNVAFIPNLTGYLSRSGLIVMLLVIFTMLYTDSVIAGNGGNPNKVGSTNKAISGGSVSNGIVGTWGYPGVAGPGGYPGVAGYGGYYPSWRHTQSKSYSGIDGNKGYPGISGNKAYSGVAGNKSYTGIAGSDGYPGIPGD